MNRQATDLIESIQSIDAERDTLNDNPQAFDLDDYAAAWGCEPSFNAVDTSLEQRAESRMYELARVLETDFETANQYYIDTIH